MHKTKECTFKLTYILELLLSVTRFFYQTHNFILRILVHLYSTLGFGYVRVQKLVHKYITSKNLVDNYLRIWSCRVQKPVHK